MACTTTHTIQLSLFHQWLVQASGKAVSEARNHSLNFNQSKECPVPRASLKRQQQTLGGVGSLNEGQWAIRCPPVGVPVASREDKC